MTIYCHIPSLHLNPRINRSREVLRRSVKALWLDGSHVYFKDLALLHEAPSVAYYSFEILISFIHDKGVFVSGGRWFAVVYRSKDIDVELAFIPWRHGAGKSAACPYRPSMLPQALFQMTPEGNDADDPFGGAANWIPFQ